MKIILKFLFCGLFFFVSCKSKPNNSSASSVNIDSLVELQTRQREEENLEDKTTSDSQGIIYQFNKYLTEGEMLDTTIKLGLDNFHIILKHYSTNDSSIVVPDKYVSIYGIKHFVSSNFQSQLTVYKNGIPFVDTIITKKNFDSIADETLKRFGVLLFPYIDVCNNQIEIHYSLSIPLTDIGENVKLRLNNGMLRFLKGESC